MRLKYPPTPEYASQHANLCVESIQAVAGIGLDYSVESLDLIEKLFFRRAAGRPVGCPRRAVEVDEVLL